MTNLQRLRVKLCRELAQGEHDAKVQTTREARRLGLSPPSLPAEALLAIAEHAEGQRPRLEHLLARDQKIGLALGRAMGAAMSTLRHVFVDRMFDSERSYRATLVGLRHGLHVARLLREVCAREGNLPLLRFCDELLVDRSCLVERAEQALSWFAEEPEHALTPGLSVALSAAR